MLTAVASCVTVVYHVSFQIHTIPILLLTYVFDIFHIIKMAINFITPFKNNVGDYITDKKAIRKRLLNVSFTTVTISLYQTFRYISSYRFYFDLFTVIPFEIFAFAAPQAQWLFYMSVLRLNKMFRMVMLHCTLLLQKMTAVFRFSWKFINSSTLVTKI